MKKRNNLGFTLIELLAVIVILGVIMVIAIPSVMSTLTVAKQKTFNEYASKVYIAAEKEYLENQMLGGTKSCILYRIKTDIGLSTTGSYDGYIMVVKMNGETKYFLTLWNDEYMIYAYDYDDIDKLTPADFTSKDDEKLSIEYLQQATGCTTYTDKSNENFELDISNIPTTVEAPSTGICYYNGEVTPGTKFEVGQYTYSYKNVSMSIKGNYSNGGTSMGEEYERDLNFETSGWHIQVTDHKSSDPITSRICTSINGEYVTSAMAAFYNSHSRSVDLSSFDVTHITDLSNMFCGSYFETLNLSGFDTRNVTNMAGMFEIMWYLKELDVSNFNTSNVTNMAFMFGYLDIPQLNLTNFNTSNVTNMRGMFLDSRIPLLNLSSFDTRNVVDMAYMFGDLKTNALNLDHFYTPNATTMYMLFEGTDTETISIKNLNTSKVTDMRNMFCACTVKSLDLSSFDTSNVTNMGLMFGHMTRLKSLDLSNFNTSNVTNMNNIFYNSNITTIDISNFDFSKVVFTYPGCRGTESIKTIYVKDDATATLIKKRGNKYFNLPSTAKVIIK